MKAYWKKLLHSWQLHVLFFLPLMYVLIFKYYPMYGAQIAFRDFVASKGVMGSEWVGLEHFIRFFQSYDFWRILGNTLELALYQLAVGFPFPIILALSLNYVRSGRFKRSVQMITYAPHFISVVVMVGIILQFLDPRTGMINNALGLLGMEPIHFMADPALFKSIYVWSDIWQNVGWGCIVYLAALASINPTLHEAAVVDGASIVRRIWHVDIPGILPITIILLILNTGNLMDLGFEKVLLMQNPLNLSASEIIDTYVYKVGLSSAVVNFSYATAIGLFKSVINLTLLVLLNQAARKVGQESLW
ncbi:ABC transporter permease [Paenibacillus chungangensis]|uniref:ABC transporter permease n=1 Tax=Paenibacillus chungangensis TaxID=696535 RepID=A0ABW3HJV5_9BACL